MIYGCYDHLPACTPPDTVAIVGLDGRPVQTASFTPLTPPWAECEEPLLGPQAYVVGNRVFYVDGRGVVRTLAADGTTATVASFPLGTQQEISFAVRPDGHEVLAALVTLPPPPASGAGCGSGVIRFGPGDYVVDIYTAEAGASSTLVSHEVTHQGTIAFTPLQLVGWDALSPLGTYNTQLQGGGSFVNHYNGQPARVNPATGAIASQLRGFATDVIADGTSVAVDQNAITVFRPDGSTAWTFAQPQGGGGDGPGPGYSQTWLAPDAKHVAANRPVTASAAIIGPVGSAVAIGPSGAQYESRGWIDQSTIIGWISGGEELAVVQTAAPAKIVDLGFQGWYIGAIAPAG